MIIKTLVENTSICDEINSEKGLSLYIETNEKKLLMDVGYEDLFLKNAKKLNIDIQDIDYVVISHGHDNNGGGLKHFLKANDKAEIFIHRNAFNEHYVVEQDNTINYIGLDQKLKDNPRIIFTSDQFHIHKNIQVFSNVKTKDLKLNANSNLLKRKGHEMFLDDFSHEQNLIIKEGDKSYLFSGCAHKGIINIIKKFKKLKGKTPDYVIGGLHLNCNRNGSESYTTVDKIAEYLFDNKISCYTGHCTGVNAYNRMKIIMNDHLEALPTEGQLEI